jgi:hypothetical protein
MFLADKLFKRVFQQATPFTPGRSRRMDNLGSMKAVKVGLGSDFVGVLR